MASLPGAQVESKDIKKLRGLSWLNDEIITYYSVMVNQRSNAEDVRVKAVGKDAKREGGLLKTYCFTSFFYAKVTEAGHVGVKRWTKRVSTVSCAERRF